MESVSRYNPKKPACIVSIMIFKGVPEKCHEPKKNWADLLPQSSKPLPPSDYIPPEPKEPNLVQGFTMTTTWKRILNAADYKVIADYVLQFKGLAIDCELTMLEHHFNQLDPLTLKGVVKVELGNRAKTQLIRHKSRAKKYLRSYENQTEMCADRRILLTLARRKCIGAMVLCRLVLQAKYGITDKEAASQLIENTDLIDDELLAANINSCIALDIVEGPAAEARWRIIDDNYRGRFLYLWMRMQYVPNFHPPIINDPDDPDEPVFVLRHPVTFKSVGQSFSWIESEVGFGDVEGHKQRLKYKYKNMSRRYGSGLVIYWFGYQEDILENPDNEDCVTILYDFPVVADLEF